MNNLKVFEDGNFSLVEDFEICAKANQVVKEEDMLRIMPAYFSGLARYYFKTINKGQTLEYKASCEVMNKRFSSKPEVAANDLITCRKGSLEQFNAFALRVKELVNAAYPSFTYIDKEILHKVKFIKGLEEYYSKEIVLYKKIETLDEAINKCWELLAAEKLYANGATCSLINQYSDAAAIDTIMDHLD
ncbi:hypothetical protein RF11_08822 [Thelohanellus kitauei]|uniref:Retrotransposon gag domain-containing protein n=1 Tax=Thelohanellus kitauei TaxID=669202 RepID=A0A0C2MAJ6_THEKT|nr:hypothetical protein RF11_08822 [Thelohanellus kitauei]